MNEEPKFVSFGLFEVDLETEELRRKGLPVRLPSQAFQVLRLFLNRPGQLVSRPELQRALWPNDSFGGFEHGLNAAINRLREALGDSADNPRFVETLPRRGYRFIAALDPPSSPPAGITQPTSVPTVIAQHPANGIPLSASEIVLPELPLPVRTRRKPLLFLGSSFAVISLILVLWWWHTVSSAPGTKTDYDYSAIQVTPLTALPGTEVTPSLSPDGSQVAFAWDGGNADKTSPYNLYIKVVGSERIEQLTHRAAAWIAPAWSPDGRNIAFARMGSGMAGIFMISALGGPERKLSDALFTYFPLISLSWSPDGQNLIFGDDRGVHEINIADGTLRAVDPGRDCALMGTPAFSPDGRWLAFSCYLDLSYDLEVMPARGGPAKKLTRVYETPLPIAWTTDSTRIIFTEHYQLNTISRKGGRPQSWILNWDTEALMRTQPSTPQWPSIETGLPSWSGP